METPLEEEFLADESCLGVYPFPDSFADLMSFIKRPLLRSQIGKCLTEASSENIRLQ